MPRTVLPLCTVLLLLVSRPAQGDRAVWSRRVGRPAGSVALAVEGDRVVTATWGGDVVTLDAATGRERWRVVAPVHGLTPDQTRLAVVGGSAVWGWPGASVLEGHDLDDGTLRWRRDLTGVPTSFAACPGFRLIAVTHRGNVGDGNTLLASAFDPQGGTPLWSVRVPGEIVAAGEGALIVSSPGPGGAPATLQSVRCEDGRSRMIRTDGLRVPVVAAVDAGRALVVEQRGTRAVLAPLDGGPSRGYDLTQFGPASDFRLLGNFLSAAVLTPTRATLPTQDGSLIALDLERGQVVERAAAGTASSGPIAAGGLLVSGWGGSGSPDRVHVLEAADLRPLATIAVPSLPNLMVHDERRAYVSTYDGTILAIALPRPAPPSAALRIVAAAAAPAGQGPSATFALVTERTIDASPLRARTSGAMGPGFVGAAAFIGDGTLLATGSNDDRVHLFRWTDGRATWTSPPLGRDVELLAAGGTRLAARIYGGVTFAWEIDPATGRGGPMRRLSPGFGEALGVTPSGSRLIVDTDDGSTSIRPFPSSGPDAVLARFGRGLTTDTRAMVPHGRWLVRRTAPRRLELIDLESPGRPAVVAGVSLPAAPDGAELVQAFARAPSDVVVEWCGASACEVQLLGLNGRARASLRFDTRGAVWVQTVPSVIDVSADGAWLFFHRSGLEPVVVRLATGERVVLPSTTGAVSPSVGAVFSPVQPDLLAITGTPAGHQVTLYRIRAARP